MCGSPCVGTVPVFLFLCSCSVPVFLCSVCGHRPFLRSPVSPPAVQQQLGRTRSQVGPVSPAPDHRQFTAPQPTRPRLHHWAARGGCDHVHLHKVESAKLTSWLPGRHCCRPGNGSQKPARPALLCGWRDGGLSDD